MTANNVNNDDSLFRKFSRKLNSVNDDFPQRNEIFSVVGHNEIVSSDQQEERPMFKCQCFFFLIKIQEK